MGATTNVRCNLAANLLLFVLLLLFSSNAAAQPNVMMMSNSTNSSSTTTNVTVVAPPPTTVAANGTMVDPAPTTNITTLADLVAAADNLTILDALLELTGLTELIRELDVTVFAPTDAALQAVNCRFAEDADFLPHLTAILLYHIIDGIALSNELEVCDELMTLNGETLTITSLSPVTINDNSTVVFADSVAANGVAHLIDQVLLPTAATSSIVDLVTTNPNLSILTKAVVAADLAPVLAEFDSVYTVFAPSDAAFAKLPAGALEALLLPENFGTLAEFLLLHVLENAVLTFDDLVAGGVFGGLTISISSNATTINNSSVIVGTNRLANNGILHIIDAVLIPPGFNLTELLLGSGCSMSDPPSDVPSDVPSDAPSDAPTSGGNGTLSDAPSDVPSDSPSISSGGGSDAPSDSPSGSFEGGSDAPSDSPVGSSDGGGGNGTTTDDYEVDATCQCC